MEKILVLFPGALGDFICFLPALESLARERSVDLLARSEYGDLTAPGVHTGSIERHEISRMFVADAGRDASLRRFFNGYDLIYSWLGSRDRNFAANIHLAAGGKVRLFPFRPPAPRHHISDYYLDCVAERHSVEISPRVPVRSDAAAWSRRWLKERGFGTEKILALAPGSGAGEKNWPLPFFHDVARRWERQNGKKSLFILGPAEAERLDKGHDWDGAIVARDLDLAKVAALLSLCDLYLGNDSGLTHLAAAVGVETVALFGPTDSAEWAPRGRRVTVLNQNVQNVECAPCAHSAMKSCPHRKCLTTLKPETIFDLPQFSAALSRVW